jgi:hypothetical protein
MFYVLNFLVPFAFSIIRNYQNSPSSRYDELILLGAQDSIDYLCAKDNNTVNGAIASSVSSHRMKDY